MVKTTTYFTPEEIEQLSRMAGLGMPRDQMAAILGISLSTFERRMNDQEGVKEAVLKGRAMASDKLRQTAYEMAVVDRNPAMAIFLLKTREGFKEAERDINLTVSQIPTDQLVAKAKEAIQYLEEHKADE